MTHLDHRKPPTRATGNPPGPSHTNRLTPRPAPQASRHLPGDDYADPLTPSAPVPPTPAFADDPLFTTPPPAPTQPLHLPSYSEAQDREETATPHFSGAPAPLLAGVPEPRTRRSARGSRTPTPADNPYAGFTDATPSRSTPPLLHSDAHRRHDADPTGRDGSGSGSGNGSGRSDRQANYGRPPRKKRSHAAVGAAIVGSAAAIGAVAFLLANGPTEPAATDDGLGDDSRDSVVTSTQPSAQPSSADPAPAPSRNTAKAERQPSTTHKAPPPPNTGAESPKFRPGQWIAVLDSYPVDTGMAADQVAKNLAAKLITAGVPARAMLANGQYPGLTSGGGQPVTGAWVVYFGPASSPDAANSVCVSAKAQSIHANRACPTYEPATAVN